VAPQEVLALRSEVLRPGWTPEQCVYRNDYNAEAFHAGAVNEGEVVVGVISFHAEPYEHAPEVPALRFQGMAVSPALQGRGVGSRLVTWALDHARSLAAYEIVWCDARTPAVNFYSRLGFERVGDESVTEWGPHYLMFRYL
jgi:GNAT superfamily N-acetyltransferase